MEWVADLSVFFRVLLYITGSLVALAGGVAVIVKLWKWMRKPHEENAEALKALECKAANEHKEIWEEIERHTDRLEKAFDCLSNDQEAIKTVVKGQKIIYKALWALLDQEISPNQDTSTMENVRTELQSYIIES